MRSYESKAIRAEESREGGPNQHEVVLDPYQNNGQAHKTAYKSKVGTQNTEEKKRTRSGLRPIPNQF